MPGLDLDTLDYISTPVFVVAVKPGMRLEFVTVNAAHTAVSGLRPEDVKGKTAVEVFPGRAGQNAWQRHAQVAETAQKLTYVITLPFGARERNFRTTLTPFLDVFGKVRTIVGTMIEVTAQRELETNNLVAEFASGNQASESEQFVSMAAHDLRAPMRNVTQIAQMLREDFVDHGDGKLELIDMLEEIGSKAYRLISDVLAYTRATTAEERSSRFQTGTLCGDVFAILDPDGQHALSCDDALVETDEVALQIVVRNLVDNAIKHGGRETLSLFVGLEGEQDGLLGFSVRDNGQGLKNPRLAFLSSGRFTYDSGFGLLGIKRMLTARGGRIVAEEPPHGIGTLIRFSLPGRVLALPGVLEQIAGDGSAGSGEAHASRKRA